MQNNIQDIDKLSKTTKLIAKHPVSFVAAVFFCMFWVTYYVNIRKNEDNEETWKELYLKEKKEKEQLTLLLLIKANIIEKHNKQDTLLREETQNQVKELLKSK